MSRISYKNVSNNFYNSSCTNYYYLYLTCLKVMFEYMFMAIGLGMLYDVVFPIEVWYNIDKDNNL